MNRAYLKNFTAEKRLLNLKRLPRILQGNLFG